ncbi:MAG: NYN domain-containing protein [Caldilineales bacterium]
MATIIDGHNLIGTGLVAGVQLGDADDEQQLVQRLRAYAAARKSDLIVVFDSGLGPAPAGNLSDNRVQVRFAPPGVEADEVILQIVRASKQPATVTVVTGDRKLGGLVRAEGGQVRSATAFARQLTPVRRPATGELEESFDPKDPAFADIFAGFAAVDKDAARFGGEITLDADMWIERLYGSDVEEASRAAHWLGRFGGADALEPLFDALTHRSATVRAAALLALADLGDRQAVPQIAERLSEDTSSLAREAAAQSLGRLGGPQAERALNAALADPKNKVRKAAAASLLQIQARQ